MRIKKVIASVMLVGSALMVTPVANAAISDCNNNNMCMWGNNDYQWMIGERAHGSATLVNLSGDNDNAMDSWSNESGTHSGCMYGAFNGTGDRQGMAPEANDNNVSPLNSDEVSSWRTRHGC
ncbi:peptidase inhibitor family I36 protein [Streptomyces anulatus]|uniref:peptidase inhibitor family I36 protein n=1 Tax=Streptomyces TaxID=1883 RepID=UPI000BEFB168|nr:MULTISPECIES: peptidase inhibitor family I36 protein [Streptomyces]QYA96596.1 peptidase inhibitor family I36 protein [Streptomyces anulatus]WSV77331.1 peptidase inhibitor family I36 protein [Streptomyces anulatus]